MCSSVALETCLLILRCFPFANVPITELKDDLGLVLEEVVEVELGEEVDLDEVGTILLVFLAL